MEQELVIIDIVMAEMVASYLTPSDREYIERLKSDSRRNEVATWRSALRRKLDAMGLHEASRKDIRYDEGGAPYLADSPLCIGVSHSQSKVAVVIADTPCAVDIECYTRNFKRVEAKYTTPQERSIEVDEATPLLPLLWSAKETLYKLSIMNGLDMKRDIRVERIDCEGRMLYGRVAPSHELVAMRYELVEKDNIVVFTI